MKCKYFKMCPLAGNNLNCMENGGEGYCGKWKEFDAADEGGGEWLFIILATVFFVMVGAFIYWWWSLPVGYSVVGLISGVAIYDDYTVVELGGESIAFTGQPFLPEEVKNVVGGVYRFTLSRRIGLDDFHSLEYVG